MSKKPHHLLAEWLRKRKDKRGVGMPVLCNDGTYVQAGDIVEWTKPHKNRLLETSKQYEVIETVRYCPEYPDHEGGAVLVISTDGKLREYSPNHCKAIKSSVPDHRKDFKAALEQL